MSRAGRGKGGRAGRGLRPAPLHPIETYGMIGNNRTAILVSRAGSIDWASFPRFDSPPTFAALLDRHRGGYFSIDVRSPVPGSRNEYIPGTNVLATHRASRTGAITIEDFCPELDADRVLMSEVHRQVHCLRGHVDVRLTFAPRFRYGVTAPRFVVSPAGVLARAGQGSIALSFEPGGRGAVCHGAFQLDFRLNRGEHRWFVLTPGAEVVTPLGAFQCDLRRKQTVEHWRRWSGRLAYQGRWKPAVARSALALKLLFFRPTGAMVAAPTTSLPEAIGEGRNWDYRFTWVRDTALAVRSLFRVGFIEEATDFVYWLLGVLEQEEERLKVLYAVDGRPPPQERTIPSLEGYRGSSPVRIGNAAHTQTQHDIFGDVLSAADLLDQRGGVISVDLWRLLRHLVERVASTWDQPDHGIWEVRGQPRHYVYSKAMAWVALDRAIDLGERRGLVGPYPRWSRAREKVREDILRHGTTAEGGGLGWYYGAEAPDASLLRLPMMGFLDASDPVMVRTVAAIEKGLVDEPFVARYRLSDGLSGTEGYFLPCAFWRVEYYTLLGDLRRARRQLEALLRHAGPLGLFAEEIDRRGRHLGNYPQAFTHLALLLAATRLDRALDGEAEPGDRVPLHASRPPRRSPPPRPLAAKPGGAT